MELRKINKVVHVENIMTIFYREFLPLYIFEGEKHNFWELVYIDSGQLEVTSDDKRYLLRTGDVIFHKPNEFHAFSTGERNAPNATIISFICKSKFMDFFKEKIFEIKPEDRYIVANIIKEAKLFKGDIGYFYTLNQDFSEKNLGSEQLMCSHLEYLLLFLYRNNNLQVDIDSLQIENTEKIDNSMVIQIIDYMKMNIDKKINIENIRAEFHISRTQLKVLFKKSTGFSVIQYFNLLKMEEAKKLIRKNEYSITEIGNMLGFETIHYFSLTFKRHFKMSPSEYKASVIAITENL